MREDRCHANIDTCIANDDLRMLEILLKNAPDREQIKNDIDSNYINLRRSVSKIEPEKLLRAKPVLDKYMKLINLTEFAGGIFQPKKEADAPVKSRKSRGLTRDK